VGCGKDREGAAGWHDCNERDDERMSSIAAEGDGKQRVGGVDRARGRGSEAG
jgi:hypothetical protein